MKRLTTIFMAAAAVFLASAAQAEAIAADRTYMLAAADQMDNHEGHEGGYDSEHADMSEEVVGIGVLHKIDPEKSVVNTTHEPIPALEWPAMTMDLPVSRDVDLTQFSKGDKVQFSLKQGRDKAYRIMQMCVTEATEAVEGLCALGEGDAEMHEGHSQH